MAYVLPDALRGYPTLSHMCCLMHYGVTRPSAIKTLQHPLINPHSSRCISRPALCTSRTILQHHMHKTACIRLPSSHAQGCPTSCIMPH
ncbi:hypothetical protein AMTR_s00166p00039890 [Amborella trichopoda]|uniref:Uncharacterized protein n=1 Tax=Amborella trichopoda TaxID=13333 RepID=W1PRP8_AMBTC|nr:hypothetical protein AMTR_s00166p00039890 [Amborella trichopoda]